VEGGRDMQASKKIHHEGHEKMVMRDAESDGACAVQSRASGRMFGRIWHLLFRFGKSDLGWIGRFSRPMHTHDEARSKMRVCLLGVSPPIY
jgi:hypothetical protein